MDRLDVDAISLPGMDARVVQRCGSTNSVLLAQPPAAQPVLLAAEEQTSGRGRRGRRWYSAPRSGVTFSFARKVARPPRELAALALVAGVATAQVLRSLGASAGLKWPNDLVAQGGKLGGILVETRAAGSACLAVIGVGINYRREEGLARRLQRSVTFLEDLVQPLPSRNTLIRKIAAQLHAGVEAFEARGLQAVRSEWLALHAHAGQRIRVRLADGRQLSGVARGLAEDGALQLSTRAGLRAVRSGRVVWARPALPPAVT